jgi:UDP-N-acetylmuramoyl-L-alanyl-D-glutamate--2,6-diaminopimelate ligase
MKHLGQILQAGQLPNEHASKTVITGITADSRAVAPGYLFAAMPGVNVDGAKFIASAIEKGAAAILTHSGAQIDDLPVPVIVSDRPRRDFALAAAQFYELQPQHIVAVTGTNGKTSVASFVRQVWQQLGHKSASLGTIGVITRDETIPLQHTTPEPTVLHEMLARIAANGVTHLALEASSHGLVQNRLDGVRIEAGAFTNLSRDHLDYHKDFEDYLAAKLRLFRELLPLGSPVVVDPDMPGGDKVVTAVRACGHHLFTVGKSARDLKLCSSSVEGYKQRLELEVAGTAYTVLLPLVGDFQVANALTTAGLCLATGSPVEQVMKALEKLEGAPGRLELVGTSINGAPIFVDYAHTPDALEKALQALRPYVSGWLHVVFGCGGDRDKGKRPLMGQISVENAERAIVTDDNPRTEDPAAIRAEVMAAAPGAVEIGDRLEAIRQGIVGLQEGDLLLVAGKGHETGQYVGDEVLPFSDHQAIRQVLDEEQAV